MQDTFVASQKTSIHFVEPNTQMRAELMRIGMSLGHHCEIYAELAEMAVYPPRSGIIIVRDHPDFGGIGAVFDALMAMEIALPVIAMDADPSPDKIVKAIKSGALDYLALPLDPNRLSASLARIGTEAVQMSELKARMIRAQKQIATLSPRERAVLELLANGGSNKEMARMMQISPRTVEIHRANMMNKLGARHASEAIRLRLEAGVKTQPPVMLVA